MLKISCHYHCSKSTVWTVCVNGFGTGEVFYLAIRFSAVLPCICHLNIVLGDGVGVNTVNHVSEGCAVVVRERLLLSQVTPQLASLSPRWPHMMDTSCWVMKCKRSAGVGDNWGSSYSHCIFNFYFFLLLSPHNITWHDRGSVREGALTGEWGPSENVVVELVRKTGLNFRVIKY